MYKLYKDASVLYPGLEGSLCAWTGDWRYCDGAAFVGPDVGLYGRVLHEVLVDRVCGLEEFSGWYVIEHFHLRALLLFGTGRFGVCWYLSHIDGRGYVCCNLNDFVNQYLYAGWFHWLPVGDLGAFTDGVCAESLSFCRFVSGRINNGLGFAGIEYKPICG